MNKFINICQFALVLMGLAVCGLFVTSLFGIIHWGVRSLTGQWVIFAGQNIFAFIIPAILTWKICFPAMSPLKAMGATSLPSARMIGLAVMIYILAIPALNQTVYWNQEMHLPAFLSGFENWCREMEALAEQQTEGIINTTGIPQTLMNIFIIGILTGIGEEFMFRGALQKMLIRCSVGPHIAIWTAAIIFSAIHFQFLGFVPRMLLGAFFGYLYLWSANIWVNAFAHALNNSLVIVSVWCINKGYLSEEFDMIGVSSGSFPVLACISVVAVAATIYLSYHAGWIKTEKEIPPSC